MRGFPCHQSAPVGDDRPGVDATRRSFEFCVRRNHPISQCGPMAVDVSTLGVSFVLCAQHKLVLLVNGRGYGRLGQSDWRLFNERVGGMKRNTRSYGGRYSHKVVHPEYNVKLNTSGDNTPLQLPLLPGFQPNPNLPNPVRAVHISPYNLTR